VALKGKNASTKRKRLSQRQKPLLPSKTVTRKGENALNEPKRLTFKPISGIPSEDVPRKGENAFVYSAKMSLAKAFTERKRGSLR